MKAQAPSLAANATSRSGPLLQPHRSCWESDWTSVLWRASLSAMPLSWLRFAADKCACSGQAVELISGIIDQSGLTHRRVAPGCAVVGADLAATKRSG